MVFLMNAVSHYYPISCGGLSLLIVTSSFYSEMLCCQIVTLSIKNNLMERKLRQPITAYFLFLCK